MHTLDQSNPNFFEDSVSESSESKTRVTSAVISLRRACTAIYYNSATNPATVEFARNIGARTVSTVVEGLLADLLDECPDELREKYLARLEQGVTVQEARINPEAGDLTPSDLDELELAESNKPNPFLLTA